MDLGVAYAIGFLLPFIIFAVGVVYIISWLRKHNILPNPPKKAPTTAPRRKGGPFEFLKNAEYQGRPEHSEEFVKGHAFEAGRIAAQREAELERERKKRAKKTPTPFGDMW